MKNLTRCFLFLVLLTGYASFCSAQNGDVKGARIASSTAERNPETWKRFSSTDGRFSAVFPGTPVVETRTVASPDGGVPLRSFTVRTTAEYSVMYVDYPRPLENTERLGTLLTNVRDGSVKEMNARLIDDKEESFEGHAGSVYKMEFGGGHVLISKAILVKNRLYIVSATTPGKNAPVEVIRQSEADASKFLKSFQLSSGENEEPQADNADPLSATDEEAADGEVSRLLKTLDAKKESMFSICPKGAVCGRGGRKDERAEVQEGMVISKPLPPYPPIARAARVSGTVSVQIIVDETGKVMAAQVLDGHPLLQAAALKAARQALFTPTLFNGKPVKAEGVINFSFILH